jgi:hypothetical protein
MARKNRTEYVNSFALGGASGRSGRATDNLLLSSTHIVHTIRDNLKVIWVLPAKQRI